ncbi:MAG: hypothetical protein ACLPH3_10245 [Terracidiphilus sp.]
MSRAQRLLVPVLLPAAFLFATDSSYREPPDAVRDALRALPTPIVSVSPKRGYAVFMQPVRSPIAEVAQPMLRLAGNRIDVNTNGAHLAPYYTTFTLMRISEGQEIKLALPAGAKLGAPIWSPDGSQFAFTNTVAHGIELWIGTAATGAAHRVDGVKINGVAPGDRRPRRPGRAGKPRGSR